MKRTPLKRAGKRTKEWEQIRRQLKPKFERAGITTCEFRFNGCTRDWALGFAHVDKRRFLKGEQLAEVALACTPCHQLLELLPRDQMKIEIRSVINNRSIQP